MAFVFKEQNAWFNQRIKGVARQPYLISYAKTCASVRQFNNKQQQGQTNKNTYNLLMPSKERGIVKSKVTSDIERGSHGYKYNDSIEIEAKGTSSRWRRWWLRGNPSYLPSNLRTRLIGILSLFLLTKQPPLRNCNYIA